VDVVIPFLHRHATWMGYFSTTGVYGDHQGAWVNEASMLNPNSKRLLHRIVAEARWIVRGGEVFRLAGIYGKGRSAMDDVMDGSARRIYKEGQVFSRIHVEDIVQVILAAIAKPNRGAIYNVCDDEPAASHEVVAYACELLNKPVPPLVPYEQVEMSAMAREFYSANRRVSNARIKDELGVKLYYPSYREGLGAIVKT
jgi:nucleoside-diphosphate-sugar epimerase